jgi:hypothetical protein
MITAAEAKLVEGCLVNDEVSTDDEMVQYLMDAFGMKAPEADFYVQQRDCALSGALPCFELQLYSPAEYMVRRLAGATQKGECLECGADGSTPNPQCRDHEPYAMTPTDAYETLETYIDMARAAVKEIEAAQQ